MLSASGRRARLVVSSLLLAAVGCVSASASPPSGSSPDVLLAADLMDWGGENLYSVVQRLRPRWINAPLAVGMSGPAPRSVVVDDVRQPGGLESLRGVRASDVAEARFVNARDATTRYGINMMSGAVIVRTKR